MKCQYVGCQEGNFCLGYHEETDEYEWVACPCCAGYGWEDCPNCSALETDTHSTDNESNPAVSSG